MTQKRFVSPPGVPTPGAGFSAPAGAPAQVNIDPTTLDDIVCECGNYTFMQVMIMKRVPALLAPNGQEGITAQQVVACYGCGKVPPKIAEGLKGWFKNPDAATAGNASSGIITTDLPELNRVEIPNEDADPSEEE